MSFRSNFRWKKFSNLFLSAQKNRLKISEGLLGVHFYLGLHFIIQNRKIPSCLLKDKTGASVNWTNLLKISSRDQRIRTNWFVDQVRTERNIFIKTRTGKISTSNNFAAWDQTRTDFNWKISRQVGPNHPWIKRSVDACSRRSLSNIWCLTVGRITV